MLTRLVFVVALVLVGAAPVRASDDLLGQVPAGVSRVSAYGGWVVMSVQHAPGAYSLHTWHDGIVAPVSVRHNWQPFDVDVGPDEAGRPTAVYSRCSQPQKRQVTFNPLPRRGCDLFAVALDIGQERRLEVSSVRHSEFAPSIWRSALAFGRLSANQRRAHVVLAHKGRPLKRLGAGTFPSCIATPCRRQSAMGWPLASDLGPQAVAYNWQLSGGNTFLGSGTEMRIARLDGSRSRLAQAGWSDGECGGTITRSPNVSGLSVRYGYTSGTCGGSHSFRQFDLRGSRRYAASVPPAVEPVSLAWDAGLLYWVRKTGLGQCDTIGVVCELLRTSEVAFERVLGGEDRPPLEVTSELD